MVMAFASVASVGRIEDEPHCRNSYSVENVQYFVECEASKRKQAANAFAQKEGVRVQGDTENQSPIIDTIAVCPRTSKLGALPEADIELATQYCSTTRFAYVE
jgi:hypothetical protein